jgi:hypothetical protein
MANGLGGKRPGAGRPKGSRNKATEEARKKAAEIGVTPLEYMLGVMADTTADAKRRDAMAQAAAPYVHPKLASVQHTGADGGGLKVEIVRFGDHQNTE